jgi:hypothetical protein
MVHDRTPAREVLPAEDSPGPVPAPHPDHDAAFSRHGALRPRRSLVFAVAAICCLVPFLTGCGSSGTQETGKLVIAPGSVAFGSVQVGRTATSTLSLSNNGSSTLQISQIQFSSQDFALSGQVALPITLYAGQNYNLTLEFAPSAAGAAGGSLTVASTGTPASATIALSGTGQAQPIAPGIELQPTSVSFNDVQINTTAAQSAIIISSGTAPLIITAITAAGTGFTVSGPSLPVTLNPTQTTALEISFDPNAAGAAVGSVTLATNTAPGSVTIDLSGTGVTRLYEVDLSWDAPLVSPDPPVGYKIFRSVNNSAVYTPLNSISDASTSYTDTTVQNGNTYDYYVESVDAEGNTSTPSNTFTATIPN